MTLSLASIDAITAAQLFRRPAVIVSDAPGPECMIIPQLSLMWSAPNEVVRHGLRLLSEEDRYGVRKRYKAEEIAAKLR